MWDREDVVAFIKSRPALARFYDLAGGTPAVLQIILGLSVVTAVMGFFSKYPYVAMACAAIFAFFGISAYLKFKEWWDFNTIDDKLIYQALAAEVVANTDGTANIVPQYLIINTAPFDMMVVIDGEATRVGEIHAHQDERVGVPAVIQAKSQLSVRSHPIFRVPVIQDISVENEPRVITVDLTIRYGKNRKNLSRRWFLRAENFLPPFLSGVPTSRQGAWSISRNDSEMILS